MLPSLHLHDIYLLPILFVALIHGIRKVHDWVIDRGRLTYPSQVRFRTLFAVFLMILFFCVHWRFATPELGPIPLTPHFNSTYYRSTNHSRLAWKALSRTPKDRIGLMQFSFAQRAPKHPRLKEVYPHSEVDPVTQYALFDLFAKSPNMPKAELLEKVRSIARRDDFRIDFFEDGVLLFVRGRADERNEQVLRFLENRFPGNAGS